MKQRGTHPSLPADPAAAFLYVKDFPMGVGMIGIDLAEVFFKDGRHGLPTSLRMVSPLTLWSRFRARSVKAGDRS